MPKATDDKKVTFRSPKADIWNSYKDLLEQIKTGSPSVKEKVISKIDSVSSSLKDSLTQEVEKVVSQINKATLTLSEIQNTSQILEKEISESEKQAKIKREREEEEYNYEFEKRKKRQEEELTSRKDEIKLMEKELEDLRKEVAGFDAKVKTAVDQTVGTREKELETEFGHQRVISDQKAASEQALAMQKIENLENIIKELREENQKLTQSANQLSSQLTKIAEKAVEKGETTRPDPTR